MDVAFLSAAAPWSAKAGRMLERWRAGFLNSDKNITFSR
jgi:hypothetical protein